MARKWESPTDYRKQPLWFQVRKLARYSRLFGVRRTGAKIEANLHMRGASVRLPAHRSFFRPTVKHIGMIGCGNFAFGTLAYFLREQYGNVIKGAMDTNERRAQSLAHRYGAAYSTTDAMRILDDEDIDLVFVASNHASHTPYAVGALERGKSVHIEKPHVVSEQQLSELTNAMAQSTGHVNLGFNRPMSHIGRAISAAVATQEGPSAMNWFVVGHFLDPGHWYLNSEEGGRVMGNLCHWTDFVFQLVEPEHRFPIRINPTGHEKSGGDVAVTLAFGDGTIAAITFSAKGHTFEGVRERFSVQRGNVLVTMDDFRECVIQNLAKTNRIRTRFRDHGHRATVTRSYELSRPPRGAVDVTGSPEEYIWDTGMLFLETDRALSSGLVVTLNNGRTTPATDMAPPS